MPSGSHRSRGGSHFSGGSRSSSRGSFFSRGISRSAPTINQSRPRHSYHFGPRRIWMGRRHYYYIENNNPILTFGFVGVIFALFFCLFFGISYSSNKEIVETIETDYFYYQDMIEYAKSHEDEGYIVDAIVVDKFYNDYADRYYITYTIQIDEYKQLEGETYSCYTLDDTANFRIGSVIKVAVNSVPISEYTDSITLDYHNMPIENDGEYLQANRNARRYLTYLIIAIVIALLIVFSLIVYMAKHRKEDKKDGEGVIDNQQETTITCKYCGGVHDKSKSKCPDCGANLRK